MPNLPLLHINLVGFLKRRCISFSPTTLNTWRVLLPWTNSELQFLLLNTFCFDHLVIAMSTFTSIFSFFPICVLYAPLFTFSFPFQLRFLVDSASSKYHFKGSCLLLPCLFKWWVVSYICGILLPYLTPFLLQVQLEWSAWAALIHHPIKFKTKH